MDEFDNTKEKILKGIKEQQCNINETESITFDFPPTFPSRKELSPPFRQLCPQFRYLGPHLPIP